MGGDSEIIEASDRLGIPADLLQEAEGYRGAKEGVFPDNMAPVAVFIDMSTQWRVGMNGITGLDYSALPAIFDIRQISQDDRAEFFECLQVMERATLRKVKEK